jgi:hypothetical protein
MATTTLAPLTIDAPLPLVGSAVAAIVILYLLGKAWRSSQRDPHLPPGPPTLPFIGNLHQMPTEKTHFQLAKWAKEYGPIFSLKLASGTVCYLPLSSAACVAHRIALIFCS